MTRSHKPTPHEIELARTALERMARTDGPLTTVGAVKDIPAMAERLAWSLPRGFADDDIRRILRVVRGKTPGAFTSTAVGLAKAQGKRREVEAPKPAIDGLTKAHLRSMTPSELLDYDNSDGAIVPARFKAKADADD